MKVRMCLAIGLLAGVALACGCDQTAEAPGAAATEAGGYASRSDFSLIPNDGLAVMDRELSRREEVLVSGQDRRDDGGAGAAELARIRAERGAIAEEMGKR